MAPSSLRILSRRRFLKASALALVGGGTSGLGALAADVAWLKETQRPPAREKLPKLSPLLVDAQGMLIRSLTEWTTERSRLRSRWLEFLGPMPAEAPRVDLEVLSDELVAGCRRRLVRYETEPRLPVEGYLLIPPAEAPGRNANGLRAGLVALHQTSNDTIDEIAGVRGPESQHLGLKLARRGFVVFCPRCFLWQDSNDYAQAVETFRRWHPGTLGMHKMLWDARRGVDVLASLSDLVDPRRIGAVGHSLGAKETLYLAAFDERIAAAVASEGGIGLNFTNWDAPWSLGEGIKQKDFRLDHHQLLALIAPRPFLILAGEEGRGAADGDRTWPYVAAALEVYRLYGEPPRLGLFNHREGHTISDATHERLAEWLSVYLK
ncbi:MAG: alpha/beta hydrolase family protein [Planctomycetales bacterium]